MYLLIGADIVPTESNWALFQKGDAEALVGTELKEILAGAACRIFNLEVPLTDVESPIKKCGPNLIAPASTVAGYQTIGVDILTLANNHILDQGKQGLESTCALLKKHGIAYLGAGENLDRAATPYRFAFGDKTVGIYACAEHEFSIATENSAGANPFDPLESLDHVSKLKQQCDYVIVLYHGGKEHYRYPSPGLQKVCRKLVDKGADLVICQHSHCIGCEEKYLHGTIVYGQGNFLFDHSTSEFWATSLLIRLEDLSVSYIPLVKAGAGVRKANEKEGLEILRQFAERSQQIQKPGFLNQTYADYAKKVQNGYVARLMGKRNLPLKIINKLSGGRMLPWLLSKKYTAKEKRMIQNCVECQTHRELLLAVLAQDDRV